MVDGNRRFSINILLFKVTIPYLQRDRVNGKPGYDKSSIPASTDTCLGFTKTDVGIPAQQWCKWRG